MYIVYIGVKYIYMQVYYCIHLHKYPHTPYTHIHTYIIHKVYIYTLYSHIRTIHRFVADESGKIIDSGVMRMAKNDYEYLELKGLLYGLNAALELGRFSVYYYICYCYISYSYGTIVLQHARNYAHMPYIICMLYNRYYTRAYYTITLYITENILIHILYTYTHIQASNIPPSKGASNQH